MIATDLLNLELSKLIRVYNDDTLIDTIALANRIFAPVKSELDQATQTFSKSLFITTALHIVLNDQESTLQQVLECIVDPKWRTESKMLAGITSNRSPRIRSQSVLVWFKNFDDKYSSLSVGSARRIVMRCYVQWCKAFNLPVPAAHMNAMDISSGNALPSNPAEQSLDCIRIGTRYEFPDACKLATKVLRRVRGETDETIYTFVHELFTAVALMTAHTERFPTFGNMIEFLIDPTWDNSRQIYVHIGQCPELASSKQIKTKTWIDEWMNRMLGMPYGMTQSLSERSHELLQKACLEKSHSANEEIEQIKQPVMPPNSIQVFNMAEVAKAMTMMCDLKDEKKAAGERLLKCAQTNNGYRVLPDVKAANLFLERAKSQFENLVDPINRIQLDLTLCTHMDPVKFRVTPLLLLGDPGIGKTFLAMELAKGLGGATEKMSAGGAQGSFQLTGTHSSFNSAKYGQVFKSLAEGKTTSPVFLVDEVDKIGSDDRYPILSVLLDLFEPDTARCFKDEFLEIIFDASRFIYILTANSLENVPEALLSRVEIYDVPRPEPAQRLRIIQEAAKQLREATGKNIKLDKATTQRLAELTDIDLRKTTRIVKEAFTKAIIEGSSVANLIIPVKNCRINKGTNAPYQRSAIGFSLT